MNAGNQEVDGGPSLPMAFVIELVDGLFDETIAGIDMEDVSCLSA